MLHDHWPCLQHWEGDHRQGVRYPAINDIALWDGIEESSEQQQGIPRIVGAINGTHIPIAIPPGEEWKGYINRKSWASTVFQCILGRGHWISKQHQYLAAIPLCGNPEDEWFNYIQSSTRIVVEQAF
ncbi:hypothetical protein MJO28_010826, partial [Puccinia striiformis f. sp. tritici]